MNGMNTREVVVRRKGNSTRNGGKEDGRIVGMNMSKVQSYIC